MVFMLAMTKEIIGSLDMWSQPGECLTFKPKSNGLARWWFDDGGQYYYDLALAKPFNENIIHVGGVNHWISTDDGLHLTAQQNGAIPQKGICTCRYSWHNYYGSNLWIACDGGIFYSNNAGDSIVKKWMALQELIFGDLDQALKTIMWWLGAHIAMVLF